MSCGSTQKKFEIEIKNKYIENKKDDIINKLKKYIDKEGKELDVKKIFKSENCKPLNLIENLK